MSETMDGTSDTPSLDAAAAQTIAAGMREVAHADGAHPDELALIDEFAAGLPPGPHTVDLSALDSDIARAAFVQTLVLVAYADGRVTDAERSIIRGYALQLGFDESSLASVWTAVAVDLLSTFSGVQVFRDSVAAIGAEMGLADAEVERALAE